MTDQDQGRAEFKTWAEIRYRHAEKYSLRDFLMGLDAWQAARRTASAAPVELPEPAAWMLGYQTMGGDVGWKLSFSRSGAGVCHRLSGEEFGRPLYTEQQVRTLLSQAGTVVAETPESPPKSAETRVDAGSDRGAGVLPEWLPIESAPKDGTHFYALIDGLPYRSFFDEAGRFLRVTHANIATGPSYQLHRIEGKELREMVNEAAPALYEKVDMIWQAGFDHQPTHWRPLPLPPPPKEPT